MSITLCQSMTVKHGGCYPSREVLRYLPGEFQPFVVHTEVFPSEEGRQPFFTSGDYYGTLELAVVRFGERAQREIRYAVRGEEERRAEKPLTGASMSGLGSRIEVIHK